MGNGWFTASKEGLRKLIEHLPKGHILFELVQNVWDEDSSICKLTMERLTNSPYVKIVCEDDNPEGFKDLTHAFTIWAESDKKKDPTKAGRWNEGEKKVLALCRRAHIASTKGALFFMEDGTRKANSKKRDAGSVFTGEIRMSKQEYDDAVAAFSTLIPDGSCKTTLNDKEVKPPEKVCDFTVALPTFNVDDEGHLRPTTRKTLVEVYEPRSGEEATLYECGIPVVATGDRFHVVVRQKVPLNRDRDNVPDSYKRKLRATVLNYTVGLLDEEDIAEKWVDNALEDKSIEREAVEETMTKRHGELRAISDPSDREANMNLHSRGYEIIPGNGYSKAAWANIKQHEGAEASGRILPTPKLFSDDPNAEPVEYTDSDKWSEGMQEVADIARWYAQHMKISSNLKVFMVANETWWAGGWKSGCLIFSVGRLGKSWFNNWYKHPAEVLDLIIHEFSHKRVENHFAEDFHKACTRNGGKTALLTFLSGGDIPHFHKVREHFAATEA